MANGKELGLSTDQEYKDGMLILTIDEVEKGIGNEKDVPTGRSETISINIPEIYGDPSGLSNVGLKALLFGVFTQHRNATGGKSFDDAIARVQAVQEAHRNGEWTTRGGPRGISAGQPFPLSSDWVAALVQVYPQHFADKVVAASWLNSQINAEFWAAADSEARADARKQVREKLALDRKVAEARKAIADARKEKKAPQVDKPLFS